MYRPRRFWRIHKDEPELEGYAFYPTQWIVQRFEDGEDVVEVEGYFYCNTQNPATAQGWVKERLGRTHQLEMDLLT